MTNYIEFIKAEQSTSFEGKNIFVKHHGDTLLNLGMFKLFNGKCVFAQYGVCFIEDCYIQNDVSCETKLTDAVNNPEHYNQYLVPVVEMTDSVLATIKDPVYAAYFKTIYEYVSRAHLKNGAEDIKKAQWWLNRLVDKIDAGEATVK